MDHAAQASMGMDEAGVAGCHRKVKLAGANTQEQHIARSSQAGAWFKSAATDECIELRQDASPQRIAAWQFCRPAACRQTGGEHPDAINAGRRIAAVKPERRAHQGFSRRCQLITDHDAAVGGGG